MASLSAGASGGEFNIGTLISAAFNVLHGAFGKFIALSAIPLIPNVILLITVGQPTPATAGYIGTASMVSGILLFMIQGAVIYGATNEMRGRPFTIGEALSKGLARFLPVLGVAFLNGLMVGIGFLLFVIPGLIAGCVFYAAVAACVVEQRGAFGSLSRSAELTKGYRWGIFWLLLIVTVASFVANIVFAGLSGLIGGYVVSTILTLLLQLYIGAFGNVLVALAYYCLRSIKDGVDIDQIADVFD